jgi:hypothetical protein
MISEKAAYKEIRRFAGTDFFRTIDDDGMKELVAALREADSEALATVVVNEFVRTSKVRPTPADITKLIARHRPAVVNCARCGDTGMLLKRLNPPQGSYRHVLAVCVCDAARLRMAEDWAAQRVHDDDLPRRAA